MLNIWLFKSLNIHLYHLIIKKYKHMKKIKHMIETAPTKNMAMDMLETFRIFGDITDEQYQKGKELIRKEFAKNILQY